MKRFIYILVVIITFSSCSVLVPRDLQKQVLVIDFRPYSDAGFFLSPSDYPGEYTPVGTLNMIIDPAVVKLKIEKGKYEDSIYSSYLPEMVEMPVSAEELLEMAVHEAAIRGANGIANLKIEVLTENYEYRRSESVHMFMPVKQYVISGFLIRIMPKN